MNSSDGLVVDRAFQAVDSGSVVSRFKPKTCSSFRVKPKTCNSNYCTVENKPACLPVPFKKALNGTLLCVCGGTWQLDSKTFKDMQESLNSKKKFSCETAGCT